MSAQVLDAMDLEREKGVTIKAKAVRMAYTRRRRPRLRAEPDRHARARRLRLRGVARAGRLRGRLLVVDAAQGIQAQTLANVYLALENDLTIIPVVNKIDLPSAEPERVAQELADVVGFAADEILFASAKEGTGTHELLEAIVERMPPPPGRPRRAAAGADLRLQVRRLQGRHRLRARRRRHREQPPPAAPHVHEPQRRDDRGRRLPARLEPADRAASTGRGRLRRDRPQERAGLPRRRHGHRRREAGDGAAAGLPPGQADGLRRASTPPRPPTTRCCATRWRSCTSATPR